jgi:hypothetical protein
MAYGIGDYDKKTIIGDLEIDVVGTYLGTCMRETVIW